MASIAPSLYMGPSDALAIVPQSSPSRHQATPSTSKDSLGTSKIHLKINKILGFTTNSPSGFDYSPRASCFAICAGSTAAVAEVNNELDITWKYFKARPNVSPTVKSLSHHETAMPTTPRTPEQRSRKASTLREGRNVTRSTGSPLLEKGASPGSNIVRQRTRAVTCVSLTADGKLLAVGEIGYQPRVLIFSTTAEDTGVPLASLSEHAFGVRCLAFSPDMRWLCSVGDCHDGFIYIWAITANAGANLYYSNKCTSFVQQISWMGDCVVSVGTRHVRIWRLEQIPPPSPFKSKSRLDSFGPGTHSSPAARTLSGRNCLPGSLIESTFTCIATISSSKAVLCTQSGDVCILNDTGSAPHLYLAWRVNFGITCSTVDHGSGILWIGGKGGKMQAIPLDRLTRPINPSESASVQFSRSRMDLADLVAVSMLPQGLITFDSKHTTRIKTDAGTGGEMNLDDLAKVMPSHAGAVLGVGVLHHDDMSPEFFTWSGSTVLFWSSDGLHKRTLNVPLDHTLCSDGTMNEIKVMTASQDSHYFISGDRSGTLRLLKGVAWEDSIPIKAHDGEINDVALASYRENTLVATCGRDRTVQIFCVQSFCLDLLQTIDQHSSAVNAILFLPDASSLLSSSSDRTIIIHTMASAENPIAYIPTRVITLKSSPISMVVAPEESSILRVSAMDRQVHQYNIDSGRYIHSMRMTDPDSNESILLSNLLSLDINGPGGLLRLMIGVSSDKSVRVYNRDTGSLVSKEYEHSKGISCLHIFQHTTKEDCPQYRLVSTGMDGTVALWDLTLECDRPSSTANFDEAQWDDQPIRRILSRVTLSDLQRSQNSNAKAVLSMTPSRGQSPSCRVRKKPSRCVLASAASTKVDLALLPQADTSIRRRGRVERSTAPPSSPTCRRSSLGDRQRVKGAGVSTDSHLSAEHISKVLRAFRKKLTSSSETLELGKALELECELNITLCAIGQTIRRNQASSETIVGDLLDQYSDKLAFLVEEKINTGIADKTQARNLLAEDITEETVVTELDERS